MERRNKISVIIPVYCVEDYLETCVRSVQAQTYEELEIILVDDGSPDGCSVLCDEYAAQDPRIRVIHQKNGGLSAARNAGMEIATGEYLYFLDSDDSIPAHALETLERALTEHQAGMALGCCVRVPEGTDPERVSLPGIEKAAKGSDGSMCGNAAKDSDGSMGGNAAKGFDRTVEAMSSRSFCQSGESVFWNIYRAPWKDPSVVAWGKLYRRELWEDIRFPVGKCHEDEFVAHYLLHRAGRVAYVPEILYYYLIRRSSITGERYQLRRLDAGEAFRDRIRFFRELGYETLANRATEVYLWWIIESYTNVYRFLPAENQVMERLYGQFMEYYRGLPIKKLLKRAKYRVFSLCPKGLAAAKALGLK